MEDSTIQIIAQADTAFPAALRQAQPTPHTIFIKKALETSWEALLQRPKVAIVGSRKVTAYGRSVTHTLAGELARAGVVVISGLAIGVDICAHRAVLETAGQTIAVLPGSVQEIYPRNHVQVAARIIKQGGALISEYPPGTVTYPAHFIARNRIVAALADALIVTEAAHKSGTLHTTRFALEQGKEVMAIPGNITSPASAGTNELLRSGATLVTSSGDVLRALGLKSQASQPLPRSNDPQQQLLIDLLLQGIQDGNQLLHRSQLSTQAYNQALTMLEISGLIRPLGGNMWSLA